MALGTVPVILSGLGVSSISGGGGGSLSSAILCLMPFFQKPVSLPRTSHFQSQGVPLQFVEVSTGYFWIWLVPGLWLVVSHNRGWLSAQAMCLEGVCRGTWACDFLTDRRRGAG